MKRTVTAIASAAVAMMLVLAGCNDKQKETTTYREPITQTQAQEQPSRISEPEVSFSKKQGVMIYTGWTLYTENDQGKMISAEQSTSGDEVSIIYQSGKPFEKKAIRRLKSGEEQEFNFVKIDYDGTEYWTRDVFVAKDAIPAIVTEDSYLYNSPDIASMTKNKVTAGSIVAYYDGNSEFSGIYRFNEKIPYGDEMHLVSSSVSTDAATIDKFATRARLNEDLKPEVYQEIQSLLER